MINCIKLNVFTPKTYYNFLIGGGGGGGGGGAHITTSPATVSILVYLTIFSSEGPFLEAVIL